MTGPYVVPFDWWWSGKYWYCRLHPKARSGCGVTKPQAAHDAKLELGRYEKKQERLKDLRAELALRASR